MESGTIRLQDDRLLAFSQYGDLNGKPVFFFHGTPGSRFFHPPDSITLKNGVRLITVDRPGYGQSTFQPDREILDWPKDILQLAENLKLQNFYLAGHSGGGPFVLACAKALQGRVISSTIVSSIGPVEVISRIKGFSTINRFGLIFGRHIPWWIWKKLILSLFHSRSQDPLEEIIRQKSNRPLVDNLLMNDPYIRNICVKSELEAFKPGLVGLAWDIRLLTRPWGFRLEDIKVPVWIWHGSDDNQVPLSMAKYIADQILSCTTRFISGEAHLMLFKYWEDILDGLLSSHE
jgi:pimeloyl-ACP methyl ester carboxylesterase